jgi:hypothetical protein
VADPSTGLKRGANGLAIIIIPDKLILRTLLVSLGAAFDEVSMQSYLDINVRVYLKAHFDKFQASLRGGLTGIDGKEFLPAKFLLDVSEFRHYDVVL